MVQRAQQKQQRLHKHTVVVNISPGVPAHLRQQQVLGPGGENIAYIRETAGHPVDATVNFFRGSAGSKPRFIVTSASTLKLSLAVTLLGNLIEGMRDEIWELNKQYPAPPLGPPPAHILAQRPYPQP